MIVIDEKYLRVHVCIGAAIKYFELNWIELSLFGDANQQIWVQLRRTVVLGVYYIMARKIVGKWIGKIK